MMDFIAIPAVVGIITFGIYSLFELFVRKKERLTLIEKMGDKMGPEIIEGKLKLPNMGRTSFGSLKAAGLLIGLGLGLLVGFILGQFAVPYSASKITWETRELLGIVYGASVLLFGGLGLLCSFLLEYKLSGKDRK